MSDAHFPSGQWIGFYTYPHTSKRYLMDLVLEFRHGRIAGEGADGIGFFGIDGYYFPKEAECSWIKTYFGRHSVEYSGFREKKGIWGTWTLHKANGGFHIWPIGEGSSLEKLREEVEEEFPLTFAPVEQPNRATEPAPASLRSRTDIEPVTRFPLVDQAINVISDSGLGTLRVICIGDIMRPVFVQKVPYLSQSLRDSFNLRSLPTDLDELPTVSLLGNRPN